MRRALFSLFSLCAVVLLAACASTKVHVDFDPEADFSSFETFAFRDTEETSLAEAAPLVHGRLIRAIEARLEANGLKKVEDDPDVYVTYHTSTREEVQVNTSTYGYGYPDPWSWDPYWGRRYSRYGWGGVSGSTTTVSNYQVGTLVIDLWDAREKSIVWRGAAEGRVKDDPARLSAGIEDVIDRMVAESRKKMGAT